jgi:hypothetical protein
MAFDIVEAYAHGLVGCSEDPEADRRFDEYIRANGGDPVGADVVHEWGLKDLGRGKLVTPWVVVEKVFPGCWPGAAQDIGDCVSHGTKNCCLITLACEIYDAKADEVTGRIEGAPEISEEGLKEGALSTEAIYWWRGHGGANGWNCADSARQVTTNAGLWPRKNYEEIGIDLTTYSGSKATKWGGSPPPENVAKIGREHLIRTATKVSGREQVRDFLAAGYGVFNCSGLGFSRTRDEHGVSRQSGSWSHSQCFIGFDDRPETHEEYGQALVCWINSWAVWNSGGRRVRGTDLDIPEGSFWALAETIDSCSCFALSSVAGWPRRKMPDYGARGYI